MGEQRARDSEFFYRLDELCELTGYAPKRLNEIAKRYKNRRSTNGRRRRVFYLASEQICNDEFSTWLLEGRFRGALVLERAFPPQAGFGSMWFRKFGDWGATSFMAIYKSHLCI